MAFHITEGMAGLAYLSNAQTFSLSPENMDGKKGGGGMCELENGTAAHAASSLGKGWKVNPYIRISAGETAVIADTLTGKNRLYLEVSSREFSVSLLEDSAADLGTHNFQNVPEGHWHYAVVCLFLPAALSPGGKKQ